MKGYQQPGDVMELTAPTVGVTVGVAVKIGQIVAIPTVTAAATVKFSGLVRGIVEVTKTNAQAWTVGALIYFDSAAGEFTTTAATGNVLVGVAAAAAANPSTKGIVRLDGAHRASV